MGTSSRGNSLKGVGAGGRATEVPEHPWKRHDLAWARGRRGRKQAETAGLPAPGGASCRHTRCLPPGLRPCARSSSAWGLPARRLARPWTGHQEPEGCVLAGPALLEPRGLCRRDGGWRGGLLPHDTGPPESPSLYRGARYPKLRLSKKTYKSRAPVAPGACVCVGGFLIYTLLPALHPHPPPPSAAPQRPSGVPADLTPRSGGARGSPLSDLRARRVHALSGAGVLTPQGRADGDHGINSPQRRLQSFGE